MSFVVRAVKRDDLQQLTDLAKQFNLLNLPGDKKILSEKDEETYHLPFLVILKSMICRRFLE